MLRRKHVDETLDKLRENERLRAALKGCALIAAVETGLLPEIERDGQTGYETDIFERFWAMYTDLSEKRGEPLGKKRPDAFDKKR